MASYRTSYHCSVCGTSWKSKIFRSAGSRTPEEDAEFRIATNGTPPCPKCGAFSPPRGIDFSNPRAPAVVGQNLQVKAIDETQKIVTQDYGLTDIRSDVRMGETAAPKLAPHLQQAADSFFGGKSRQGPIMNAAARATNRALSGMMRQPGGYDVVGSLHAAANSDSPQIRDMVRPKVSFVAGTGRYRE